MTKQKKIFKGIRFNRKNQLWYCIQHGGKKRRENFQYRSSCRHCMRALDRNPGVQGEMADRARIKLLPEKKIEPPVGKLVDIATLKRINQTKEETMELKLLPRE